MKHISNIFIVLSVVLFIGCSTKEVYTPKSVKDDWHSYGDINTSISEVSADVAMLEDRRVLFKDGTLSGNIEKSFRVLGHSDGWILSSNINGQLVLDKIGNSSQKKRFNLKKTIAGASVKDDNLAVLFADNELALYSISKKSLLVKIQGNPPIVVDNRILNPYFMKDLVIFLTLDGKIVIVNSKLRKKLRTTIISSEDKFNNIIYFNIIDKKLIAATGNKILSMAKQETRIDYEIRDVIYDGMNLYISTKQGEIISLTSNLQVNAKVKFPFAHFLGLISYKDKIYALEKEGYIIELSKNLKHYDVYEVNLDDGYVFVGDKKFYINGEYISVEQ